MVRFEVTACIMDIQTDQVAKSVRLEDEADTTFEHFVYVSSEETKLDEACKHNTLR